MIAGYMAFRTYPVHCSGDFVREEETTIRGEALQDHRLERELGDISMLSGRITGGGSSRHSHHLW